MGRLVDGRSRLRNNRGIVVIVSLGLVVLLSTLGSSLLTRSLNESRIGRRSLTLHRAFYMAEAGLDQALLNLRTPADAADDVTSGALLTGTYAVDAPVSLSSMVWQVTSHGYSDGEHRRVQATVQLTPQSVFQFALFGDQIVSVSGSAITDSYDSRDGAYDEDDAGHNGDIGTNSTGAGGIAVGGSIFVDGQVAVGAGAADPETVVTGYDPAFITGGTSPPSDTQDVVAQSQTFPMPAVTLPGGLTCTDATIGGNSTVTLASGTYCYNNLTIQGGGTLTTDGEVTIYLIGSFNAQGNSSYGVPSDPSRMIMLVTPSGDATIEQGSITGSTEFYGAIYAPESTINITGNANVFGSIIAERINMTGSAAIHYDEALTQETQIANVFQTAVASWQELTN
jgi:hypothetical protein